jgi:mRNA interferase MazF
MNDYDLFNKWNCLKKDINEITVNTSLFLQPRDVWMASLGKNIGYEQNGSGDNFSRPILIVKKFNNQMFWIVPLSKSQKSLDFYYNYTDPLDQSVSVILAQLKLVSIKRCNRLLYRMDKMNFENIIAKLIKFLTL